MSDLEITDAEADVWFSGQLRGRRPSRTDDSPADSRADIRLSGRDRSRSPLQECGRLHLLLGDSVAFRSGLGAVDAGDDFFNGATGGATWRTLLRSLPNKLEAWRSTCSSSGRSPGSIVIWMSGNDIYSRLTQLPHMEESHLSEVVDIAQEVLNRIRAEEDQVDIIILGPLPRLSGEVMGATWESTAAYHLERALLKRQLGENITVIKLGRALTKKISHKRSGLCLGCLLWFDDDRVHLSPAGYQKLALHLPSWMKFAY